jgi:hypothetical protein
VSKLSEEKSPGWDVLNRARKRPTKRQNKKKPQKLLAEAYAKLLAMQNAKLKDRFEALRRNEQYRQEWEIAFADYLSTLPLAQTINPDSLKREPFLNSPQAEKLANRWGLNFVPHPDDSSMWTDPNTIFKDQGWAVDIIRHGNAVVRPDGTVDRSPHLEDKRYLTLKIDLLRPKIQAINETSFLFDRYLTEIGKKKTRGSAMDEELHWKVWDLHHKEGMSLLAISRKCFPKADGKDPNTDPTAKKYYEKVRAAYYKAKELIEKVTPACQ